jgi:predicted nucleotidyltransferase
MPSLADATLAAVERRTLARFVDLLQDELGPDLCSIWPDGSRARGESRRDESDIDLIVVSSRDRRDDNLRVVELVTEAADAEGANPAWFSVKLYTPARVSERRAIRSFFFEEVDRDKIVLFGAP